eukprot:378941_1
MVVAIALLFALILSVCTSSKNHEAQTNRFIVAQYINPLWRRNNTFPLDICVNYEVHRDEDTDTITYLWGKFVCGSSNEKVTFTDYGTDATCTGEVVGTPTDYIDTGFTEGDLYSFNCVGDDTYALIDACTNDDTCCSGPCVQSTFVSGICVNEGGGIWKMGTCDAGSAATYTYSEPGCPVGAQGPVISLACSDTCTYYATSKIGNSVHLHLTQCVVAGSIISNENLCTMQGSRGNKRCKPPKPYKKKKKSAGYSALNEGVLSKFLVNENESSGHGEGMINIQFLLLNVGISMITCLMVIVCCLSVYYACIKFGTKAKYQ